MKTLFRIVRYLVSSFVSGLVIAVSGYGKLVEHLKPEVADRLFIIATLGIAIIVTMVWEMHLKINALVKQIESIEINQNI